MNEHRTYLIVFLGETRGDKIYDKGGDDPCFSHPPTWGICRPNVRNWLKVGDILFFLAKIESYYILKGWFEVGEKIDYLEALNRYPERKNVIISKEKNLRIFFWGNKMMKKCYQRTHNNKCPNFLSELLTKKDTFYQNQLDTHPIDNWKCKRILNCNDQELAQCVQEDSCKKSEVDGVDINDDKYKNYIVANPDRWDGVDYLRITIDDIKEATGFKKALITPCYQHNVQKLDEYKDELLNFIDQRKKRI